MTKREKLQIIWAYKHFKRYRGRTLEAVYKKSSIRKQQIWAQIKSGARMIKGYNYDLTIITYNTNIFTCGYTVSDIQNKFVYFTPSRDYEIFVSDIIQWANEYGVDL